MGGGSSLKQQVPLTIACHVWTQAVIQAWLVMTGRGRLCSQQPQALQYAAGVNSPMHMKLSTGNCRGLIFMSGASKLPSPVSCTIAIQNVDAFSLVTLCSLILQLYCVRLGLLQRSGRVEVPLCVALPGITTEQILG